MCSFRGVAGEREGAVVRGPGVVVASEPDEELGARRVEQVVAVEVEGVDGRERGRRPLDLARAATARLSATTGFGAIARSWS